MRKRQRIEVRDNLAVESMIQEMRRGEKRREKQEKPGRLLWTSKKEEKSKWKFVAAGPSWIGVQRTPIWHRRPSWTKWSAKHGER
jgi:hypothetical protein